MPKLLPELSRGVEQVITQCQYTCGPSPEGEITPGSVLRDAKGRVVVKW